MFLLSKKGAILVLIGSLLGLLAPSDADSIRCQQCKDNECEGIEETDCPNVNACANEAEEDGEVFHRKCGEASLDVGDGKPRCYLNAVKKPKCYCFTDLCNKEDPNVLYKKTQMGAEGSKPGGAAGKSTKISASCGLVLGAMAVAYHCRHPVLDN